MDSSQEYQENLIKFQYFKEQLDMFQGQLEIVNTSLVSVLNTKKTVENIKAGVKPGDEILIPIGGRVNIKAAIKETDKILLAVTQDVIIEKDLDGTLEFLDKIIEQHNKQIEFLRTQIQTININLQAISQNIQRDYTKS
jgi:prefoldin alpha subunit